MSISGPEKKIPAHKSEKVTLVVGAGITGLTAATLLAEAGLDCLLLEKEPVIGGACRSLTLDDIVFDIGPHVFLLNEQEPETLMMGLLKGERVISRRFRYAIHSKGKLWKFPASVFDLLMYPWEYKRQMIASFLKKWQVPRPIDADAEVSVEEELINKAGEAYYKDVLAPMIAAKTLLPGNKLHRDWVARVERDVKNKKEPFIGISRTGLLKKLVYNYHYPYEGFEVFVKKLHERYLRAGGRTILDCGPVHLEKHDGRIVSATVKGAEYSLDRVVWTGSVNGLNRVLGSDAPEMRYIKTIVVFLTYDRAHPVKRPYVYEYYTQSDLIFNRVYFPYSIYREWSPPSKEGICLELNYLDGLDGIGDDEVVRRAAADVEKVGLFKAAGLRRSQVVRLGESIPLYELDYDGKMSEAYKNVHAYVNLYSVGRQGGYFFCLSPAAVRQGMKMARHILQDGPDTGR